MSPQIKSWLRAGDRLGCTWRWPHQPCWGHQTLAVGWRFPPFPCPNQLLPGLEMGRREGVALGPPALTAFGGKPTPPAQPQRAGQTDRQSWMHAGGHGHFHTSPSTASRPARCSARGSKKETHKTQKHNPPGAPAQPRRAGSPAARGVSRLFSVLKEQKIPIHFFF